MITETITTKTYKITKAEAYKLLAAQIKKDTGDDVIITSLDDDMTNSSYYTIIVQQ